MKIFLLSGLFIAILCFQKPAGSFAQSAINFEANVSSGSKYFMENGKRGFGAGISLEKHVFRQGALRGFVGFDWFERRWTADITGPHRQDSIKVLGLFGYDISFLPVRFGYEQYVLKNTGFLSAEAGMAKMFSRYDKANAKYTFTYAVGAGYKFPVNEKNYLQLATFYNFNKVYRFLNLNYISLRLSYGIVRTRR